MIVKDELKEQLKATTKRKSRKRKRIQHGGAIKYKEMSAQIAAKASGEPQQLKKGSSSSRAKRQ